MRSSAPFIVLLFSPVLACFADGGRTSVASTAGSTTTGNEAGATTEPTTHGTVSGPDTSSSDVTTQAPTTAPTTGAAGNCEVPPECQVGAVETGAQCEGCGVLRRTCQADCTWTPMACEEELSTCAYWFLPENEVAWQRFPVDPQATFAPKDTVLAAVALAPQQQIYVLTATNYHVFSTTQKAGSRRVLATPSSPNSRACRCSTPAGSPTSRRTRS